MKNIGILIIEVIISVSMMYLGLTGKHFLWIHSAKSAFFTLGVIGFVLCTCSIGTFISQAPSHPLTIGGYIGGTLMLISIIAQIFSLPIPVFGKPENALGILGSCIIINGIIAQFKNLVVK